MQGPRPKARRYTEQMMDQPGAQHRGKNTATRPEPEHEHERSPEKAGNRRPVTGPGRLGDKLGGGRPQSEVEEAEISDHHRGKRDDPIAIDADRVDQDRKSHEPDKEGQDFPPKIEQRVAGEKTPARQIASDAHDLPQPASRPAALSCSRSRLAAARAQALALPR